MRIVNFLTACLALVADTSFMHAGREERDKPLSILLADDHPVVREGLAALINRRPDMKVVAETDNGRNAVEQFFEHRPDVALLDLRMPVMGGLDAVVAIINKAPAARLVILTTYEGEEDIYRALRAGAKGYVLKDVPVEELMECLRAVAEGRTWIPPKVAAQLAKRVASRDLTPRELEVLRTVTAGKSNKEIGVALNISEATVKVHVTHILEKLKVGGRTEAIRVSVEHGIVHLDSTAAT